MADFVSLLKKTIDAQSNVTPQLRERVYVRARETIEKKLVGSNISQAVIDQQFAMLEEAITSVEAEYQAAERALLDAIIKAPLDEDFDDEPDAPYDDDDYDDAADDQDDVCDDEDDDVGPALPYVETPEAPYVETPEKISLSPASTKPVAPEPEDDIRAMVRRYEERVAPAPVEDTFEDNARELIEGVAHIKPKPVAPQRTAARPANASQHSEARQPASRTTTARSSSAVVDRDDEEDIAPRRKNKKGNFDAVTGIFKDAVERKAVEADKKKRKIFWGIALGLVTVIVVILALGWSLLYSSRKDAVVAGTDGQPAVTGPAVVEKLTQRLMPDGTETNPGPAEAPAVPGEGKTVSPAIPDEKQEDPSKVVLYQAASGSATEKISAGRAKWSIVQEKPDSGGIEEAAIRGDIAVPDENLLLRMTIRRNQDQSIPAAYVVEMIFVVPDGAKEGPVAEVRDLKFKGSEQMTGQPLAGTSYMKIGDNFFLFPISDVQPFTDSNLRLMRQLPWIRIVADFKSGRTMELTFSKGSEGEKAFKQVITHWLADENTAPTPTPNR